MTPDIPEILWTDIESIPEQIKLVILGVNRFGINANVLEKQEQVYIKQKVGTAIISMRDEYYAVGSCRCSECEKSIDIFAKYCSHCGAKLIGRKTFDKDGIEMDS